MSSYVTNLLQKFDLRYKDVPVLDPSDLNFEEEAEKLLQTSLFIDGAAGFGKSFLMKALVFVRICIGFL